MKLKLATKIWIPTLVVAFMLATMSTVSAVRTIRLQSAASADQAAQQTRLELSARWLGLVESNAARAIALALSSEPALTEQLKADSDASAASIAQIVKQLDAAADTAQERAAMATIAAQQQAFSAALAQARQYQSAGQAAQAQAQVKDAARPALASLLKGQEALLDAQEHRARALRQQAGDERMNTVYLASGVMGTIVALALLGTWRLQRTICDPLKQVVNVAEAIGHGDLAVRIDNRRSDEMGDVLRSLEHMAASLGRMVGQVRVGADGINTASGEIATGNQNLSLRTEQAAANLQQTASSIEQLTGTVKQSADSARQANALASSAAEVAARGGNVVSQVVSTMDEINASSKKIADIIGVIDGIAFQTNILALNAAVEAARAGEQGRGFAVVASEVRSLAGRSAEAAREIKGLIGASVDKVEAGSRLVADAGTTMTEIVTSVQRVTDIIGEITAASSEQSDGIGQINQTVMQLDQMTQANSALVEQSAAAAQSMRDQARKLAEVVSVFRMGH